MASARFDPEATYRVWLLLIADEELFRATLAGEHEKLALSRGLTPTDVAILDGFRAERGTRWNVENLRFRAATEVATKLQIHLPRTLALLTEGNETWLQDIVFEYLAYYRWHEFGHHHFAECARFVAYIHERIAKRRRLPRHLDVVLKFETTLNDLIRRTRELTREAFPPAQQTIAAEAVAATRPRWAPAVQLIDLDEDISQWIHTGLPRGEVRPGPLTMLAVIPSLDEGYRLQRISDGARFVLERCTGEQTAGRLAEQIEAEDLGLERRGVLALIQRWVNERTLFI
jgi:hypothetical protein